QLRAHLRECKDCATLERRQRAQRAALTHLGAAPLPASLAGSFFGSGTAGGIAIGGFGIGAKVATIVTAGLVAAGVGHEAVKAVAAKEKAPRSHKPAAVVHKASSSKPASGKASSVVDTRRTARHKRRGKTTAGRGGAASVRSAVHAEARGLGSTSTASGAASQ